MNTNTYRYPARSRLYHWLGFCLIVAAYATINARVLFERGGAARLLAVESHFLIGLAVLALAIPRIVQRLSLDVPPIEPPVAPITRLLAGASHLLLYAFLVVQPLLGVSARMLEGRGVGLPFTEYAIPSLIGSNVALGKTLEGVHVWLGTAFYYVIGLHILGALWHFFVRRDALLQRML